jgi:hypothetical protein
VHFREILSGYFLFSRFDWSIFVTQLVARHMKEIIQIKNDRGKIYPIFPDNELFTFGQIIYLTPYIESVYKRTYIKSPVELEYISFLPLCSILWYQIEKQRLCNFINDRFFDFYNKIN